MSTEAGALRVDGHAGGEAEPVVCSAASGPRWVRWSQTLQALAQDRVLAAGFAVLSLISLAPLLTSPILPFVDLGMTTATASYFWDALLGRGTVGEHFQVQWRPVPYWTTTLLGAVLTPLLGFFGAAKAKVALCILILPLGLVRLLLALERNPRLALLGFIFAYNHNLYWGWIAFVLGFGLALFAFAKVIEADTWRKGLRVIPWAILIALTHVHPTMMFLAGTAALVLVKRGGILRALAIHSVAAIGGAVLVLPFLYGLAFGDKKKPISFEQSPLFQKASSLLIFSFGDIGGPRFHAYAGVAFFSFLGALLLAFALNQRRVSARSTWAAALLMAVAFGFYLYLPWAIHGPIFHFYNYPRFMFVMMLFSCTLPRPELRGKSAWALVPIGVAVLLVSVGVGQQFYAYGQTVRPLLQAVQVVKPGSRILALPPSERGSSEAGITITSEHLHAYVAAATKSYDSRFFDEPQFPVAYRQDRKLPVPHWNDHRTFNPHIHAPGYNYIFVQGLQDDPVRPGVYGKVSIAPVWQAGIWRLYQVVPLP